MKPILHAPGIYLRFEKYWIPEPNSGCWLWLGGVMGRGYGRFNWKPANNYTHRASWMLYRGDIPKKMDVCHSCDVPWCVNPDHLFVGTRQDNIRDMMTKGRGGFQVHPERYKELGRASRGRRYVHLLSDKDISVVKYLIERGAFYIDIARVFKIHKTTIADIAHGRSHGDVQ